MVMRGGRVALVGVLACGALAGAPLLLELESAALWPSLLHGCEPEAFWTDAACALLRGKGVGSSSSDAVDVMGHGVTCVALRAEAGEAGGAAAPAVLRVRASAPAALDATIVAASAFDAAGCGASPASADAPPPVAWAHASADERGIDVALPSGVAADAILLLRAPLRGDGDDGRVPVTLSLADASPQLSDAPLGDWPTTTALADGGTQLGFVTARQFMYYAFNVTAAVPATGAGFPAWTTISVVPVSGDPGAPRREGRGV